jgi:transposase InsO family protein
MAPLATPVGTWVRLDRLALLIQRSERTLWNWRSRGELETREQLVDGRRVTEVLVESLPLATQQAFLEHRAQLERTANDARAAADAKLRTELLSDEVTSRLGRYDDRTRMAFKSEATRRRELLQMWSSTDKQIAGEWSPAARAILQEWSCPDPLVLAVRPSWADPGTPATLYRHAKRLDEIGILALLPDAPKASRPDDRRLCRLPAEVIEEIKRLRLVRFPSATLASLYRKLVAKYGDDAPSESTFKRLLRSNVSRAELVLARDGKRAFNARAGAHLTRSYDALDVGEWFCGDEHQFDVMVVNPYRDGALDRPWLTAFTDLRSRALIGWTISFDHNTETIIEAFIHGVRPKRDASFANLCGLPKAMYIDNGKDYRSARFELMLAQNGVEVHHALPFNAKAKNVERQFGTLCSQFSRDQVGYFGNKPSDRPGRFPELVAQHERWLANKPGAKTPFMTLAQFKQVFSDYVIAALQRESDGLYEWDTGRARSPLAVAGDRREAPRVPRHEVLEYLAMPRFERTVRRGQIKIDNFFYRHEALLNLGYGEQKVLCRRSPADITELYVYTERDEFICLATAAEVLETVTGGMSERDLKELKRARRENQRVIDDYHALKERTLAGEGLPLAAPPRDPEPTTATSSATVASEHTVIAFVGPAERAAKQARAARDAARDQVSAEGGGHHDEAAPMTSAPLAYGDDDAFLAEQLGPRPVIDKFDPPRVKEEKRLEQSEWDKARDWLLAERRATSAR